MPNQELNNNDGLIHEDNDRPHSIDPPPNTQKLRSGLLVPGSTDGDANQGLLRVQHELETPDAPQLQSVRPEDVDRLTSHALIEQESNRVRNKLIQLKAFLAQPSERKLEGILDEDTLNSDNVGQAISYLFSEEKEKFHKKDVFSGMLQILTEFLQIASMYETGAIGAEVALFFGKYIRALEVSELSGDFSREIGSVGEAAVRIFENAPAKDPTYFTYRLGELITQYESYSSISRDKISLFHDVVRIISNFDAREDLWMLSEKRFLDISTQIPNVGISSVSEFQKYLSKLIKAAENEIEIPGSKCQVPQIWRGFSETSWANFAGGILSAVWILSWL